MCCVVLCCDYMWYDVRAYKYEWENNYNNMMLMYNSHSFNLHSKAYKVSLGFIEGLFVPFRTVPYCTFQYTIQYKSLPYCFIKFLLQCHIVYLSLSQLTLSLCCYYYFLKLRIRSKFIHWNTIHIWECWYEPYILIFLYL